MDEAIENKSALNKFADFVKAQGGDESYVYEPDKFQNAKYTVEVKATQNGYVRNIFAESIGNACMMLGGGRETKDSVIDLTVGIYLNKKVGEYVEKDGILATIYANDMDKAGMAKKVIFDAYELTEQKVLAPNVIKGVID